MNAASGNLQYNPHFFLLFKYIETLIILTILDEIEIRNSLTTYSLFEGQVPREWEAALEAYNSPHEMEGTAPASNLLFT